MLILKDIVKDYQTGDTTVKALRNININFRENEFVSILGPSGCGKTTLLNLIGGLDRYTSGDLVINGKSTKTFRDGDWDTYRNHSIGFVFQSYNLIPHQSVLANVELALTLSGVSKRERRERAIAALEQVGLKDHIPAPYQSQLGIEILITGCDDCVFLELILEGWVPISFLAIYSIHACYVLEKGEKIGARF